MMPLTMVKTGEPNQIKRVGGKEETKRFLENLGFVAGGMVTVVSEIGGNMIVNVKDSRVAIGKDMANKIIVLIMMLVISLFFLINRGCFGFDWLCHAVDCGPRADL